MPNPWEKDLGVSENLRHLEASDCAQDSVYKWQLMYEDVTCEDIKFFCSPGWLRTFCVAKDGPEPDTWTCTFLSEGHKKPKQDSNRKRKD